MAISLICQHCDMLFLIAARLPAFGVVVVVVVVAVGAMVGVVVVFIAQTVVSTDMGVGDM